MSADSGGSVALVDGGSRVVHDVQDNELVVLVLRVGDRRAVYR